MELCQTCMRQVHGPIVPSILLISMDAATNYIQQHDAHYSLSVDGIDLTAYGGSTAG